MPSFGRFVLLALASTDAVLSFPGHKVPITTPPSVPALPTLAPYPVRGIRKRQDPGDTGDIVATYGTGSVLSKLHPHQMANATAGPNPYCSDYANPHDNIPATCACQSADPTYVPFNSISGIDCAYTAVPGTFTTTADAGPTTPPPNLNQPCTMTDDSGVVWAYPSEQLGKVPGYDVTVTECAGPSSAVSTVSSIAAQASILALETNGWCGYIADDVEFQFGVLIPNWMTTFDKKTADNDLKGSLGDNSACNSYSFYESLAVGPGNTTLAAKFFSTKFCTAWEVTQVIKKTTGNAWNIPCHKVTVDMEFHPEANDAVAGEAEEEEGEIEFEPGKKIKRALRYLGF